MQKTLHRNRQLFVFSLFFCLCACLLDCSTPTDKPPPKKVTSWSLQSPNQDTKVKIEQKDLSEQSQLLPQSKAYYFQITYKGKTALLPSPLGLETAEQDFVSGLTFVESKNREVKEEYTMLLGKRSKRVVHGNELTLRFKNTKGKEFNIIFRAHNDGVAFRYQLLGSGKATVKKEATSFVVPKDGTGFIAPYDVGIAFSGVYEQVAKQVKVGEELTIQSGWAYPALFETAKGGPWIQITEADLDKNYCASRLHPQPNGGIYPLIFPPKREGQGVGEPLPSAELPFKTPWRVIMVGTLSTIVESTLVDDLSPPNTLKDTSWIKPGRVAWSWYSQETGDEALQRKYMSFAKEMTWEHFLIDDGWDKWKDADKVMAKLIADAKTQGVGVILWYNSAGKHSVHPGTPREKMLDPSVRQKELEKIAKWGAVGIKVDFFESDKQDRIQQYIGILEDAAKYKLMVNFHGATLPRGWQRTYPHLMTYEAVHGAEHYKFQLIGPTPIDDVRFVFIRNTVGSMDYTPVTFEDALKKVGSTYAHELALSVAFESAWQNYADRADDDETKGYRAVFKKYPFVKEFLKKVPATWDDTRLMEGDPRSHVVIARRKGKQWYIAGLNGLDKTTNTSSKLDFLGKGSYKSTIIRTGEKPDECKKEEKTLSSSDTLKIEMKAKGGFVVHLVPK